MNRSAPALESLTIAADPDRWAAAGFAVVDGHCRTGQVELHFVGDRQSSGIESWSLPGVGEGLDGLRVERSANTGSGGAGEHPNGTIQIDHVVAFTPALERTRAAFEAAGIGCRRVREYGEDEDIVRQGFFRVGEVIAEIVETPQLRSAAASTPASFWGITFTVADLDACAELLGDKLGSVRDAVQPGRRIATVQRGAGLGLPVALMTPEPAKT